MKTTSLYLNITRVILFSFLAFFTITALTGCTSENNQKQRGLWYFDKGIFYFNSQSSSNLLNLQPNKIYTPNEGDSISFYSSNKMFGLINTTNKGIIVPAIYYEDYWDFDPESGLAAVVINGKMGFIDRFGTLIITPQYDFNTDNYSGVSFQFQNGTCMVPSKHGKVGIIDTSNTILLEPIYDYLVFDDGYYKIYLGDSVGMVDAKFNVIFAPVYDLVDKLDFGFVVKKHGEDNQFLLDFDLKTVLCENVYDGIASLYVASSDGYDGDYYEDYEDSETENPMPAEKSVIYSRVFVMGYQGVISNYTGKIVVPAIWDDIRFLSDDIFIANSGDFWFALNAHGDFINLKNISFKTYNSK